MLILAQFLADDFDFKVRQTDMMFGMRSEFISRPVRAGLDV